MTEFLELYQPGNFIDTFALGHYARVVEAFDVRHNRPVALKVMRPEHLAPDGQSRWESEAFINESDLLQTLSDLGPVMKYYDCGYVQSSESYVSGGEIKSFETDLDAFRSAFYPSLEAGWRPYLALELLPRHQNLLYVMKPSAQGQRWRLPTEEGIDLALQFGDALYKAHERGIVYLDHKLEHVYWDGKTLRIIDWNSSKRVGTSGQSAEQHVVNDLHNLCVGILYPIFTGQSPQKGSLRPQPASQQEVEARYENIASLDFSPEPSLSQDIIDLLETGAQKRFASATEFLGAAQSLATRFGWSFPGRKSESSSAAARNHIRQGLEKLRESQDNARIAREHLLEAATLEGLNEEIEAELRRMLAKIGDFLNNRTLP